MNIQEVLARCNTPEYKEKVKAKELTDKLISDTRYFSFDQIKILSNLVGGFVTKKDCDKYGNFNFILFSKYPKADKAIRLLRERGLNVSERLPNYDNSYFKYKIEISQNPLVII